MLIVSTLLLMLKLFFKTPDASNPSSHTKTDSTDHNYPKNYTIQKEIAFKNKSIASFQNPFQHFCLVFSVYNYCGCNLIIKKKVFVNPHENENYFN